MFTIKAHNISKRYSYRLFSNISCTVSTGESIAIVGPNGSGKSTLLKIMGNIVLPDSGRIEYVYNEDSIPAHTVINHAGIVAPYIQCYNHLTLTENIIFAFGSVTDDAIEILHRLNMYQHKDKVLHTFSTGMLQRCKIAMALLKKPELLLLDEAGSNLDDSGRKILYELIKEIQPCTAIILATNDSREAKLCHRSIVLDKGSGA
ncbi:MAG: ATP-binding cassette domain-containing protein [Spirochaetota bacterium]